MRDRVKHVVGKTGARIGLGLLNKSFRSKYCRFLEGEGKIWRSREMMSNPGKRRKLGYFTFSELIMIMNDDQQARNEKSVAYVNRF